MTALCFVNLELLAGGAGRFSVPTAAAQAPNPTRVAVYVVPASRATQEDAQVLQTLLREAAAGLEGVHVTTGSPDPAELVSGRAAPLVEEGARALRSADGELAEASFGEAYALLVQDVGATPRRLLARTLKGLGVARVMEEKGRSATDMIRASLNVWPDQMGWWYEYSLDVRGAFKAADARGTNQAAGGIGVVTEPPGAEVWVGGQFRGYSPMTVGDLSVGMHWVQASLDGFVRSGDFVTVRPGESVAHILSLQGSEQGAALTKALRKAPKTLRNRAKAEGKCTEIRTLSGAESLLIVRVARSGGAYKVDGWLQDGAGTRGIKTTLTRDATFLDQLGAFLADSLGVAIAPDYSARPLDPPAGATVVKGSDGEDIFIDPNDPILRADRAAEDTPITSEWWFWTAIGVAVVGLGVGAAFLFAGDSEGTGPTGDLRIRFNDLD